MYVRAYTVYGFGSFSKKNKKIGSRCAHAPVDPEEVVNMRRGFTMIEFAVVIAIVAILAAILFPVPAGADTMYPDKEYATPSVAPASPAATEGQVAGGAVMPQQPPAGGNPTPPQPVTTRPDGEVAENGGNPPQVTTSPSGEVTDGNNDNSEQLEQQRTIIVRQLIQARSNGNQQEIAWLSAELDEIDERLVFVEANALGGEHGQHNMWRELDDAGLKSKSYLEKHYGLVPVDEQDNGPATVSAENDPPATEPANKELGDMNPNMLIAVLGGLAALCVVVALLRNDSNNNRQAADVNDTNNQQVVIDGDAVASRAASELAELRTAFGIEQAGSAPQWGSAYVRDAHGRLTATMSFDNRITTMAAPTSTAAPSATATATANNDQLMDMLAAMLAAQQANGAPAVEQVRRPAADTAPTADTEEPPTADTGGAA